MWPMMCAMLFRFLLVRIASIPTHEVNTAANQHVGKLNENSEKSANGNCFNWISRRFLPKKRIFFFLVSRYNICLKDMSQIDPHTWRKEIGDTMPIPVYCRSRIRASCFNDSTESHLENVQVRSCPRWFVRSSRGSWWPWRTVWGARRQRTRTPSWPRRTASTVRSPPSRGALPSLPATTADNVFDAKIDWPTCRWLNEVNQDLSKFNSSYLCSSCDDSACWCYLGNRFSLSLLPMSPFFTLKNWNFITQCQNVTGNKNSRVFTWQLLWPASQYPAQIMLLVMGRV